MHKSSFSRQLSDAAEIMSFRDGTLLNRKDMFNRCKIPEMFFRGNESKVKKAKQRTNFKTTENIPKEPEKNDENKKRQLESNYENKIEVPNNKII